MPRVLHFSTFIVVCPVFRHICCTLFLRILHDNNNVLTVYVYDICSLYMHISSDLRDIGCYIKVIDGCQQLDKETRFIIILHLYIYIYIYIAMSIY